MKYILRNPLIILCFVTTLLFGWLIFAGDQQNFSEIYIGKMASAPIRYMLLILVLFTDYLVFENMNHYTIICRNKSTDRFIIRTTVKEIIVISMLFILLNIPVILSGISNITNTISTILLFTLNGIILMILFTTIIRFINIWISNRAVVTGITLATYAGIEFIVEYINYTFMKNQIFDFQDLFILPFKYINSYLYMAIAIIISSLVLTMSTCYLITKKDYILKHNEDI